MPVLPPDRGHLSTERRNASSGNLHQLDVEGCVGLIQAADQGVPEALTRARPALVAFIQAVLPGFAAGGRLVYVGAGTSGRLGVLDASEAPPTFQVPPGRIVGVIAGGDAALRRSSEGAEDDAQGAAAVLSALALTSRDAVLAIAAGGTTPYALGALVLAKQADPGVVTGLLCCTEVPKPPACDHLVVVSTGPEVLTGSTRMKAGTATKLALNTISTTLMVQIGKVFQGLMVDLRATNAKLRDRAARIVSELTGLTRPQAFDGLEAAGGQVKVAVLMHQRGWSKAMAEAKLEAAGGRLDRCLVEGEEQA